MSLERYADNPNLAIEVQMQRKKDTRLSPIGAFARILISDAETELVSWNRGANSPVTSILTADRPINLPYRDSNYTRQIESHLYWGNAVIAMEELIKYGDYDHQAYIDMLNQSIGRYGGNSIRGNKEKIVSYSYEDIIEIAKIADFDPTFSIFATDRSRLLPHSLKQLWNRKKVFPIIHSMQPDYKKAAEKVVLKDPDPYSRDRYQKQNLRRFDLEYQDITVGSRVKF